MLRLAGETFAVLGERRSPQEADLVELLKSHSSLAVGEAKFCKGQTSRRGLAAVLATNFRALLAQPSST